MRIEEQVRDLLKSATPKERAFLKGVPSLGEITRGLDNYRNFDYKTLKGGRRVAMVDTAFFGRGLVGCHFFSVMENANATPYEREYADMGSGMNYVYLKKLFVHPDFRGEGIGMSLLDGALEMARDLGKNCIADVNKDNYLMSNILLARDFKIDFNWVTPSGVRMDRFYR